MFMSVLDFSSFFFLSCVNSSDFCSVLISLVVLPSSFFVVVVFVYPLPYHLIHTFFITIKYFLLSWILSIITPKETRRGQSHKHNR